MSLDRILAVSPDESLNFCVEDSPILLPFAYKNELKLVKKLVKLLWFSFKFTLKKWSRSLSDCRCFFWLCESLG